MMTEKEYKEFLYQKIHEISEQKESFKKTNESLISENEQMKEKINSLVTENEELKDVKDYIKESLEISDEELEERFAEKTEEEKYAKYLMTIIKKKGLDPKQVISFMQEKAR